jgi:uncharacterized membrane protein YoaK (UPF0700 family)
MFAAYVVGAYCGATGDHQIHLQVLVVPIASLAVLIGIDLIRPLAKQDEEDQQKLAT